MATAALAKAGVELVVEGLTSFKNDLNQANSSLSNFAKTIQSNAITSALNAIGDGFSAFGQSMMRVAEIALGVLVRVPSWRWSTA